MNNAAVPGTQMEPLVSAAWLAGHLRDPDLRVFDATVQVSRMLFLPMVRSGRRDWRRGHIPGSAFADLFALGDPHASRHSFTLPSAEYFAAAVGKLGIGSEHRVILYDRRENMWACRLWWMLRYFGHDRAAVLDGGWAAWRAAGQSICRLECAYRPATFVAHPRPQLAVSKREVLDLIGNPRVCLVNALGRRQHRGEVNEYGRRGHIPGSRNVTAWEVLDRETGCYRPLPELREKLGGVLEAERVVTYCGAGAAAASLANVVVRLGHPSVAIYEGGLYEWCRDRSLPLEVGG
ncbi:sulfurtransferase [Anaeromyxobacter terrae]|uniref:sulfurtransferase n=1 Tax=Anaeromyxobacter terrae TaxID=2925406 RepID=UPI001F580193|nr:sulfurtransferase [Anaeromyxobacter sp. SG22]